MAIPIKETPILYGKDSDRFLKEVEQNELKTVSVEEYNETKNAYDSILKSFGK